mgnify:CR=1 FL=1
MVCYKQKERPACLFDAVSSVLCYYGDNIAAKAVNEASTRKHPVGKSKIDIINSLLFKKPHKYNILCVNLFITDDGKPRFDIKEKDFSKSPNMNLYLQYWYAKNHVKLLPKIRIIEATDGTVNHAVGFCGKYIFDTNLTHAMHLTQKGSNWCASTENESADFVRLDARYVYLKQGIDFCFRFYIFNK